MKTNNKATILGVGTELTTGQILNKNASWLSEKLIPYGLETSAQITVPDERSIILNALNYCAQISDYIFITGGLGPTSDDFTRDVIADWTKKDLVFDETSWGHIQVRLVSRGFTVKDIQRQQAYFPQDAKILTNSNGTANGFYLVTTINEVKKHIVVLPGPPREIEAIWNDHLTKWLFVQTQLLDKKITRSWDTLGVGESDVAVIVEDCLKEKWPDLKLDIGYRVHLPYVEVKCSYMQSQENLAKPVLEKIDNALKNITVLKNFADIVQIFSDKTNKAEFAFYDFVTGGFLHSRLSTQLKKYKHWLWKESSKPLDSDFFNDEDNFIALLPTDETYEKCIIIGSLNENAFTLEIEAPMKSPLMIERRKQFFAEMALIEFCRRT